MQYDSKWCFVQRQKFEDEIKKAEARGAVWSQEDLKRHEAQRAKLQEHEDNAWRFDEMKMKKDDSAELAAIVAAAVAEALKVQKEEKQLPPDQGEDIVVKKKPGPKAKESAVVTKPQVGTISAA